MPLQYTCRASTFFIFFIKVSAVDIVTLPTDFLKKKKKKIGFGKDSPTAFPDPCLLRIIGCTSNDDGEGNAEDGKKAIGLD